MMIQDLALLVCGFVCGLGGFWLGFLVAAIMSASGEADQKLEAMRQKHIADVTDWLEKQGK